MTHLRELTRLLPGLLAVLVFSSTLLADTPIPESAAKPVNRALLVGCTRYPMLAGGRWDLVGPTNDVGLMAEVLRPFGFEPENMTILRDWPDQEALRPTRVNIEAAFVRLAKQARPGEQVFIHMSGHGSQQPANPTSADVELDGLDEIFLPADVKGWNGRVGSIENSIVDNEIAAWLEAIRATGANVWVVFDCCHAGTMTRGDEERERYRYVPVGSLVPSEILAAAQKRAASQPTERPRGAEDRPVAKGGDLVAFYACQPNELAPEMLLPATSDRYQGLLTYTVAQVLTQSHGPLTYRDLADGVLARYRAMNRWQPTPSADGTGLAREVFGSRTWPDRPTVLLGKPDNAGRPELLAGGLHGIRPGSILAVYPPAGAPDVDKVVGHIRTGNVWPLTSSVVPVAFADLAKPDPGVLLPGSRCRVVFVDYGDLKMRVALQTQSVPGSWNTHAPDKGPKQLEESLAVAAKSAGGLFERTAKMEHADWFVRASGDRVVLVPAAGWATKFTAGGDGVPAQFAIGSPTAKDLGEALASSLSRIARARQLLSLAGAGQGVARGEGAVAIELEMLRRCDASDAGEVVSCGPDGRTLSAGDGIAFRVTNPGKLAVDVTLLFVDSGYGISSLFPPAGTSGDNRLPPGQSLVTPLVHVTADTVGAEQVVAIAVRAGREPVDFTCLEQLTLERARGSGGDTALTTPIGQLLQTAVYGQGNTRGLAAAQVDAYTVRMLPWTTLPGLGVPKPE